jgi:hypothetical protein
MSRPGLYCEFTTSVSRSPQGNSFGAAAAPGGGDGDGVPEKGDQSREGALIPRRPAPPLPAKADGGKSNQRERERDQSQSDRRRGPRALVIPVSLWLPPAAAVALIQCNVLPKAKGRQQLAQRTGGTQGEGVRDQAAAGADGVL